MCVVGEPVIEDKPSETPEETGEVSEAPSEPSPEEIVQEEVAAAEPAPEGNEDEEQEVVQGADDTSIAPSTDPVMTAFKERYPDATFKDKDELFDSFENLRTRLSQRDEDAVYGREVRSHGDAYDRFRESLEKEQAEKTGFVPPEMPVGMHLELQKPEAERDPQKVEQYNSRQRYIGDRWAEWMTEPNKMLSELVLPAVEKMTGEMFAMQSRKLELKAALEPHNEYINKYGPEILEMSKRMPVEEAIELHQLRRGTKPVQAAQARNADAAKIASSKKSGPRVSEPGRRPPKETVNLSDPASIMRAELAKGPVDETPLTAD